MCSGRVVRLREGVGVHETGRLSQPTSPKMSHGQYREMYTVR